MTHKFKALLLLLIVIVALPAASAASCKAPVEENPLPTTPSPSTTQPFATTSLPTTTAQTLPTTTEPAPTTTRIEPTATQPATTQPPVTTTTTPPATQTEIEPTTTPPPTTTYDPYSYYRGYLLEGYPEDIWPLFESVGVESCTLDVQYPAYNNFFDSYAIVYYVIYKSEGEKDDIVEYYLSLLAEREESGWYDAIGSIQGYGVSVRVDDGRSPADVYISVTPPDDPAMTSNPLLEDFPKELFPLYELNEIWAEVFNVNSNPPGGQQFAEIYFSHSGTRNGALEFYRDMFGDAEGYEEVTVDEWKGEQTTLRGFIYDYHFTIVVGVWGDGEIIQVRLMQPLDSD